ncbi:ROK family transcriptional regulator [Deinococcus sp. A31D244]|uniref:ROK family transcriptional regulator n=1 Tax=Deinococcus sp. A31D244 TaxID=3397675 RepID=UPI0039E04BC7
MSQPHALRRHNRRQILELIFNHEDMTRPQLAQLTGLSQVTVNAVVKQLQDECTVQLVPAPQQAPGRAARFVQLAPQLGTVMALDLQPDLLSAQMLGLARQPAVNLQVPVDTAGLTEATLTLIEQVRQDSRFGPLRAVLIGLPAPVSAEGHIGEPSAVPTLDVAALQASGTTVWFENDANLVSLAVHGRTPGLTHVAVLVERSSGTGMGLILGGTLYRGVQGRAGELGRAPWPQGNSPEVLEQLPAAQRLTATAFTLAGLCHALDLEQVVLGLDPVRCEALEELLGPLLPPGVTVAREPDVAGAALGGAALCAVQRYRQELLDQPRHAAADARTGQAGPGGGDEHVA